MNSTTNTTNADGLSHLPLGVMPEKQDGNVTTVAASGTWSSESLDSWAEKHLTQLKLWESFLEEICDDEYGESSPELDTFLKTIGSIFSVEELADLGFAHVANILVLYENFKIPKTLENFKKSQKQFKSKKSQKHVHFSSDSEGKSPRRYKSYRGVKRDKKRSNSSGWESQMRFNPITPLLEAATDIQSAAEDVSEMTNVFKSFATPDLFDKVKLCVDQLSNLGTNVSNKVSPELIDHIIGTPDTLVGVFQKISSVLEGTKESIGTSALWISIGAGLYYLHSRDKTAMYISGVAGVFSFVLTGGSAKVLTWLLQTYKPAPDVAEEQFGIDELSTLAGVGIAALAGIMGLENPRTNWPKLAWEYFDKRERLGKSLSDWLKAILSFFEWAVNKVSGQFGKYRYIRFLGSSMPIIDEFLDRCDSFRREVESDEVPFTQTAYDRLLAIHAECEKLIRELPHGPPTQGVAQLLRTRMTWLDRKRLDFANSSFGGDGSRPEPVGILLSGPPGTGKTQLLSLLHNALTSATIPEEMREEFEKYPDKFLYSRHMESEYWDQYDNFKWICLFDDLGQIRDQVGMADGEWMNIIRAINNCPYALHMAGVDQKGKTFFKSKFVICTTNQQTLKSESILDMDAVRRRLHIKVKVTYNPEFTTQNPDGSVSFDGKKLPDGKFTEDVPLLMLEEGTQYRRITFKELVDMSLRLYAHQQRRYEEMVTRRAIVRNCYNSYCVSNDSKELSSQAHEGFEYGSAEYNKYMHNLPYSDKQLEKRWQLPIGSVSGAFVADGTALSLIKDKRHDGWDLPFFDEMKARSIYADSPEFWERPGCVREWSDPYFVPQMNLNVKDYLQSVVSVRTSMDVSHIRNLIRYMDVDSSFKDFVLEFEHRFALEGSNWNVPYLRMSELCDFMEDHAPDVLDTTMSALYAFYKMFKNREPLLLFFDEEKNVWDAAMMEFVNGPVSHLYLRLGVSYPQRKLQDVRDYVNAYLNNPGNSVYYNIHLWIKHAYKLVGVVGSLSALYYLYRRFFNKSDTDPVETQSFGHSDKMHHNPTVHLKNLRAKIAKAHPQMATHFDPSCTDVAFKICKRNVYEFIAQSTDGMQSSGFGVFIADRLLLTPAHFVTTLAEGCAKSPAVLLWKIVLKNHSTNDVINMTFSDFVFASNVLKDESDLALTLLPKGVSQEHPNIVGHFIKKKDLDKIRDVNILIPRPGENLELHTTVGSLIKQLPMAGRNDPTSIHYIHDILRYQGPFTKGDCGRPAFLMHRNSQWGVFAGIHVAGNVRESFGASAVVSYEELINMMNELLVIDAPAMEEQMLSSDVPESFALIRTVSKPVLTNARSKIRRSKIYGMWGDANTTHSRLRPFHTLEGELIDPFKLALVKYTSPSIELPIDKLDYVARQYGNWLNHVSEHNVEGRNLTFDEAVLGLEGHRFFSGVKRNTSPGYPFIHEPLYHGRGCFAIFGDGQEFDLTTRACIDLKARVHDLISKAEKGIRTEIIYTDNLKDERVAIEKWKVGKTRLFSGSPEHYKIAFRMLFGQFSEWFALNHTLNGSAIGVNPYSKDWHVIAQNLRRVGGVDRSYGAGDYSGFDGSEKPEVHNMILRIINNWYIDHGASPESNMARTTLWKEITNSKHIRFNVIYEWFSSLPSGNPMTAIVNTMYNNICIRYCWLRMFDEHFSELKQSVAMSEFNENVYFIALGDDNLFAVGPHYREYFTEVTIAQWMKEIGMVYTSETKDCANVALRPLEEVEFLKRSFRYDNVLRRWLAPLRLSVVLEIPYWTKDVPGQKDAIAGDNVQEALNELALYPEPVFDEWSEKIVHAYRKMYSKNPVRRDFVSCKEFTLNLDEFWF